jgi:CubicO group peptidase (beta-lactamase class C family)
MAPLPRGARPRARPIQLVAASLPVLAAFPTGGDAAGQTGQEQAAPAEAQTGEAVSAQTSPRLSLADSLEHWYASGLGAYQLCSGLWVVGRDHRRSPEEVLDGDVRPFPHMHWEEGYAYEVHEEDRSVTVTAPGVASRTAAYNGDQGCAILPAGNDRVSFEPVPVPSDLPDPEDQAWPTGDRGAVGTFSDVDRDALEAVLDWAFDDDGLDPPQNTRGLVILYRGKILAERYAPGWSPYTPQISWSMGKSLASALTGVMVRRGFYGPDDRAPVEEWRGTADPRSKIRIRDLLRMSSGLDFDNLGLGGPPAYRAANEHMRIYFDALPSHLHAVNQPLRFEPGAVWRYRNSDPLSLMLIMRRALEAAGEDHLTFPQRELFDRIGMRSMVLETDAWGNFLITGRDFGGTRDWARFGLLHLWDGVWEGERILPEGWTEFVATPAPGDPSRGYGGLFWLNRGGAMDRIPRDAYWAAGHMGQTTMIIPSREMVVARQGPSAGRSSAHFNELVGRVLEAVGRPLEEGRGGNR